MRCGGGQHLVDGPDFLASPGLGWECERLESVWCWDQFDAGGGVGYNLEREMGWVGSQG